MAFKARRAAILISKKLKGFIFDKELENENLSVDDKLLELTKSYAGELITNDVYLKIKAFASGVRTSGYGAVEDYYGITYWEVDPNNELDAAELNKAFDEHLPPERFSLKENEFLIAIHEGAAQAIFLHKKNVLETINPKAIKNKFINKITPKNPEQICLFNLLSNPDITILYAGGKYGSGKSFILNNFALQELEQGNIRKIVYVPNNSYVQNTMELGALPGELLSKVVGQIGPMVDLIGLDWIEKLISRDELEVVPMSSIRGRSFEDSIIIINEAQNLTEDHIKLLIGRCGKGSRIFFDGDMRQADSAIFKNKNGLKLLLKLSNSDEFAEIFGTVRLEKIERSRTAQAADYLDEITGGV